MLDLTDLFRANDQKMPDAMVTEMRRHLEGAVTTVETGMMFGLRSKAAEVAPMMPDAVETLGYGYCWSAIEMHHGLAGPELGARSEERRVGKECDSKGGSRW